MMLDVEQEKKELPKVTETSYMAAFSGSEFIKLFVWMWKIYQDS